MNEQDEYELRIGAYSPATIPMERLAKYMAALAKLLGNTANVHFDRLLFGSTNVVAVTTSEAAPKVYERVQGVHRGDAANDAMAGSRTVDELAREDNTDAHLVRRPGKRAAEESKILYFAGAKKHVPERFGPIFEATTLDGELTVLGGADATVHAKIKTSDGVFHTIVMSRELGEQLNGKLWRQLRAIGTGKWERREDQAWHLILLTMTSFEQLADESLVEVTKRLREMGPTGWSELPDVDAYVRDSRGESLH